MGILSPLAKDGDREGDCVTIYKITGYDYNVILMDAGLDEDKMKVFAYRFIMRRYGVAEEQIRNIIVDKMDGVIAVTVADRDNDEV